MMAMSSPSIDEPARADRAGADVASADRAGADRASAVLDTQVGRLQVVVTDVGLHTVRWIDPRGEPPARTADDSPASNWTAAVVAELAEYFEGSRTTFDAPLDWRGLTPSQLAVLRTLFESVPFGATITYGELAARSGTAVPARGIGAIMGANRLPIVVPCHRVLSADGLGGYSGGYRAGSNAGSHAGSNAGSNAGSHAERVKHGGSDHSGLEAKRWLLTFEGALAPTLGWDPSASRV